MQVLRDALPQTRFVDATTTLEALRAVKSARELALIREASEGIVASMLAAFRTADVGMTEQDLVERVRREQTNRGLTFEYCLITSGPSHNRAPSSRRLQRGEIVSLDTAGHLNGYIGDMARMGVLGTPTRQMHELLEEIESVQAVEAIDDLLTFDAVDGVMIGPYDLSGSLGIPGQLTHLRVTEACSRVVDACRRHGKACGTQIVELTPDCASQAFALGYTFAVLASDVFLLWKWSEQARQLISSFKKT